MQTNVWNPQFKPYIHSEWDGTHIIDLEQTSAQLNSALNLTACVASHEDAVFIQSCSLNAI